jgi:hypothetical protein
MSRLWDENWRGKLKVLGKNLPQYLILLDLSNSICQSTGYEAPHTIFSILCLLHPSWVQPTILLSAIFKHLQL